MFDEFGANSHVLLICRRSASVQPQGLTNINHCFFWQVFGTFALLWSHFIDLMMWELNLLWSSCRHDRNRPLCPALPRLSLFSSASARWVLQEVMSSACPDVNLVGVEQNKNRPPSWNATPEFCVFIDKIQNDLFRLEHWNPNKRQ